MLDFDKHLAAYRLAAAQLHLHYAQECPAGVEAGKPYDAESGRLNDIHSGAINRLLLTPASDHRQLSHKIEVIVAEAIHDNWALGSEIMALLGCDAQRLLERGLA